MKKIFKVTFALMLLTTLTACTSSIRSNYSKNEGDAYFEKGDYKKAIIYYDKAIKLNDRKASAYSGKARALEELEKYEEAIKACDKAIELNKNLAEAYDTKGSALAGQSKLDEALYSYQKSVKLESDNATYLNNMSYILNLLQRYDEAVDYADRSLKIDPRFSTAYLNKGFALSCIDKTDDAIKCYDKALKYEPESVDAYLNKGILYQDMYKDKEAIECYDKVIKLDPKNHEAIVYKGEIFSDQGKDEEAIKLFDKAIDILPKESKYYVYKGRSLYYMQKYKESIECLDKALSIDKTKNDAKLWKAKNYLMQDEDKKAEALCKEVLKSNQKSAFAYDVLGKVLTYRQKYNEANSMYDKALKISPDFQDASVDKISNLLYRKNYQECLNFAKDALSKFPLNIDIIWYIADCYSYQNMHEEAIKYYKKVTEINSEFDRVYALIAYEYYVLQDFKNSEVYNKKAIDIDKDNKTAQYLKKELDKRKLPEAKQIADFVKDNYLYIDKVKNFDKKTKNFISTKNVSMKDIDLYIKSVREKNDKFTFVISGKDYDYMMKSEKANKLETKELDNNIFYVRISSFTENTSNDFRKKIISIKKHETKNLVIDLRDNGGGLADQSNEILDFLLPACTTSYLIYRDGYIDSYYSDANMVKFKKIFVLTNEYSASSSEILTLGLKKFLPNVTIVGRPTFGKGVGQSVYENKKKKYMIFLVSFYWNIKEKNILDEKIAPDVRIKGNNLNNYLKAVAKKIK